MKNISKHITKFFCLGIFIAMPAYAELEGEHPSPTAPPRTEPTATPHQEPSASPSATPHSEPSASPSATPHSEPSATPSATPHSEPSASPSATPHSEPSATPHPEPSPTPHTEPSATPHDEPSPSPTETEHPHSSPTPTPHEPGDGDGGDDNHGDGDHGHGDVSLRGFYEGTTASAALAVFYIEKNSHVQIHLLDVAGQTIGFAEGALTNGSFALTLTTGQAIIGQATENGIAGTVGGEPFQAQRVPTFGSDMTVAGRYVGVAHGPTGESTVMFIIDANKNVVMIQRRGNVLSGGYGTITAPVAPSTQYTFTLNGAIGSSSTITGSFSVTEGVFSGTFQTSDGTFTFSSFKKSLANHMANISTRALVGPAEAQLIGGFIITGGPKMVLIRALGPSLAAAGVSNPLANPSLRLYAAGTLLGENDDWEANANAAQIVASTLPPANSSEAAILVRLEPGAYTTVVSGATDAPAIALVEVYEIGSD